jgi:hypothetical protein
VRREDGFVQSHAPYAVDLIRLIRDETYNGAYSVNAVWFRRRRGVTVACIGILRTICRPEPDSVVDFLCRGLTDGRYGGVCLGRWDGEGYWGAEPPGVVDRHLAILRPMLENYPAVPPGYDGWWTFR